MSRSQLIIPLLLLSSIAMAEDTAPAEHVAKVAAVTAKAAAATAQSKPATGDKMISGMSILGNQEAPKSLVIVPWKSSEIGASIALSAMLDDSRRPVDKDVFMRELGYYEIRSQ
jgi:hypothetical protein